MSTKYEKILVMASLLIVFFSITGFELTFASDLDISQIVGENYSLQVDDETFVIYYGFGGSLESFRIVDDPQVTSMSFNSEQNSLEISLENSVKIVAMWIRIPDELINTLGKNFTMLVDGVEKGYDLTKYPEDLAVGILVPEGSKQLQIVGLKTASVSADELSISDDALFEEIQSEELILLLDIREIEEFDLGHIEGAASARCDEKAKEKILPRLPKTVKIILVDEDGSIASDDAEFMVSNGLDARFLEGGMKNWDRELVTSIEGTTISAKELSMKLQNNEDIFLLDVREIDEHISYHIPGDTNIPLGMIFEKEISSLIPDDKEVILICKSGNRAMIASFVMAHYGIDYKVLENGMIGWINFEVEKAKTLTNMESPELASKVFEEAAIKHKAIGNDKGFSEYNARYLQETGKMKFGKSYVLPPLHQQYLVKIPQDIKCKEGFELTFKLTDNKPICVKPVTKLKLENIGWAQELKCC